MNAFTGWAAPSEDKTDQFDKTKKIAEGLGIEVIFDTWGLSTLVFFKDLSEQFTPFDTWAHCGLVLEDILNTAPAKDVWFAVQNNQVILEKGSYKDGFGGDYKHAICNAWISLHDENHERYFKPLGD